MITRLKQHLLSYMEGGPCPLPLRLLALSAARLFHAAVRLRHWAYRRGWLSATSAPVPVISIGNIVAGGSGKTPLALLLADLLSHRALPTSSARVSATREVPSATSAAGRKLAQDVSKAPLPVAILTRGYRSRVAQTRRIERWRDRADAAAYYGDEPTLMGRKLPGVAIWVGRDRVRSAKAAVAEGARLLLLDDGMQYRRLAREEEIVLIDARDPWGRGGGSRGGSWASHFLPCGRLRDLPERLAAATLIVAHHVAEEGELHRLGALLAPLTAAPLVGARWVFEGIEGLRGKRAALFCGLGRPERFIEALERESIEVVQRWLLEDHASPDREQLAAFARAARAQGADVLVCTEKDAVKLSRGTALALPLYPIAGRIDIAYGRELWEAFLLRIRHHEWRTQGPAP